MSATVAVMPATEAIESPLEKAVRLGGGQAPLARKATAFGPPGKKLTQGMIWKWLNTAKEPVPSDIWVIPIEQAVRGQVRRTELRPDLYPPEQLRLEPTSSAIAA